MAEGVRFELTVPCGTAVFKTAGLNHSPIPPLKCFYNLNVKFQQKSIIYCNFKLCSSIIVFFVMMYWILCY